MIVIRSEVGLVEIVDVCFVGGAVKSGVVNGGSGSVPVLLNGYGLFNVCSKEDWHHPSWVQSVVEKGMLIVMDDGINAFPFPNRRQRKVGSPSANNMVVGNQVGDYFLDQMAVIPLVILVGSVNGCGPVNLRAVLEDVKQVVVGEFGPAFVVLSVKSCPRQVVGIHHFQATQDRVAAGCFEGGVSFVRL
jgi:hypothetical protein